MTTVPALNSPVAVLVNIIMSSALVGIANIRPVVVVVGGIPIVSGWIWPP